MKTARKRPVESDVNNLVAQPPMRESEAAFYQLGCIRENRMAMAGETYVKLGDAQGAIDAAFESLKAHCISQSRRDGEYTFDFGSAIASVRRDQNVLWIRVQADEYTICHGIKMLLEGELRRLSKDMATNLLWVEATEQPFTAITAYSEAGGNTEC